jgi:nicotinamide riboside transporter PnuC
MISEWIATVCTIFGTFIFSSPEVKERRARFAGFVLYLVANIGFIIFAVYKGALGLLITQVILMAFSIRGMWNNRPK